MQVKEAILRIARIHLSKNLILSAAQTNNSLIELREHTLTALILVVFTTLLLVFSFGIITGKNVLLHISKINNGLENAIENDFSTSLVVENNNDEFYSLTINLNFMLTQFNKLIQDMRQVTDNVCP